MEMTADRPQPTGSASSNEIAAAFVVPVRAVAIRGVAASAGLTVTDFDELFRHSWAGMVRLALLLLGDRAAAEDVVADAFANTYRHWAKITDIPGATGYVRTAVVNGSRSALRRRVVARSVPVLSPGFVDGADVAALLADDHAQVVAALGTLPRRQREVLVLRYWGGLSEAAIADTLKISRGTVKSTASRALAVLTKKLGNEDGI